jgi:hypothetical protein
MWQMVVSLSLHENVERSATKVLIIIYVEEREKNVQQMKLLRRKNVDRPPINGEGKRE